MGDLGTAVMRAVDIVVVNGVLREMTGETRAIAGFSRVRKLVQQKRELVAGHLASPSAAR
jgi:hypothetical protein